MRGASRAGQEEGKPRLSFLFVFSGAGQGRTWDPFRAGHEGHRQYRMPVCWAAGWPYGAATASSWNRDRGAVEQGGRTPLRQGKKLCRPHREKGRGKQAPNVRTWGQESRPGADLGRPGSGNGPSEEGQSMRRGRKGARNDRDASIREGRQQACRRAMGTKKALAVSCKGEIWWAIRDSNPEPTD